VAMIASTFYTARSFIFGLSWDIFPIFEYYVCKMPFIKADKGKYNAMSMICNILSSLFPRDKAYINASLGNLQFASVFFC
jgi:hypothetical protein